MLVGKDMVNFWIVRWWERACLIESVFNAESWVKFVGILLADLKSY